MSTDDELKAAQEHVEKMAITQVPEEMLDFVSDEIGAQRYLSAVSAFRKMIPKATKPTDWVLFGDPSQPDKCPVYLQAYAAQQISQFLQTKFGYVVSIDPKPIMSRETQMIDDVENLTILYNGYVKITDNNTGREKTEPIIGTASTNDPLLGRRHGKILDPQQVPIGNLMKKALTNYNGNAYRTAWGLKGFTLDELSKVGLNISAVHDSKRRSADSGSSEEDRKKQEELWNRILTIHDNKANDARAWLRGATSWSAGTRKDGSAYNASEGFDDIARLRVNTKLFPRIVEKVERAEKDKNIGMEESDQKIDKKQKFKSDKYITYEKSLGVAISLDQIIAVEKMIAVDKTLSKEQKNDLQELAEMRSSEFQEA